MFHHEWNELIEVETVFSYVGKIPDNQGFFFLPTIPDSAYMSDKACFSYVGKIPDDRGFYFFSTIPDFAYIPDNRQKSVPDSPYYELGGKWKVCQKLSLEHKCNSIYTATLMHTSLCCVVLNTSVFLHSSMQGFPFWKSRSQLKTPYHSSSFLGKRFGIAMTRIFEKCYLR